MGAMQQDAALADEGQMLENLTAFLGRFEQFKQQQVQAPGPVKRFLSRFKNEWPEVEKQQQEWEVTLAPRFNIFRVLRIERKEMKLHSRFLAELFNPLGRHCQGDYFLRLFLTEGQGLKPPKAWPDLSKWQVTTEEDAPPYGRLDIVLRCKALGFITVFENKVDAGEQPAQLDRYAGWLDEQKRKFPHQNLDQNLVFLTPDRRRPGTDTHNRCVCLSYRQDIRGWLIRALANIRATPLCCALEQYLQVIDSL